MHQTLTKLRMKRVRVEEVPEEQTGGMHPTHENARDKMRPPRGKNRKANNIGTPPETSWNDPKL
jgi:hypothetical protein